MNAKGQEQVKANSDFIQERCQLCGGEDVGGIALSEIKLNCGYGSRFDLRSLWLTLCGKCADALFVLLNPERAENEE